jgi:hypothetical protein
MRKWREPGAIIRSTGKRKLDAVFSESFESRAPTVEVL